MSAPVLSGNIQWPGGEPAAGEMVLLTERDDDALALADVLRAGAPAEGVCTIGVLPGCSLNCDQVALAYEVATLHPSRVYLLLDGDRIGRAWAMRARWWLRDIGVRAFAAELPVDGKLGACLVDASDPGAWLADLLADAERV